MTVRSSENWRLWAWIVPTALAALCATRYAPLAVPAALVLLCYWPGACAIGAASVARDRSAGERIVLSVAASLALAPLFLNLIWHFTNDAWLLLLFVWIALHVATAISALFRRTHAKVGLPAGGAKRLFERKLTVWWALLVTAFLAFATIGPYWPTALLGYPVPSAIHDFVKHQAVLFSLQQQPLPLGNPFFADAAAGPVYYYHFFYLIPATVRAIAGGISIELAFGIQSAIVAVTTTGMVFVITKRLTGRESSAVLAAALATIVGGLDIIALLLRGQATITLDVWADHLVRIHNLLNQMIWSPQNVSGITIVLLAVYLLSARRWWVGWYFWGPALGASLLGASPWVAFPVMLALPIVVVLEAFRDRDGGASVVRRIGGAAIVAALMAAASAHTLWGYSVMSARHGRGLTAEWPHHWNAVLGKLVPAGVLANLLDLPWILFIEMGALLVLPLLVGRAIWRRAWDDAGLRWLLLSAAVAIAGYVTVRSHFDYNDFGQKSMMVALICGAILGGCALQARSTDPRHSRIGPFAGRTATRLATVFAIVVMLLGFPVALYEAPATAIRRYVNPAGYFGRIAPRNSTILEYESDAYVYLRDGLPAGAVLQGDWGAKRVILLQIARRQLGVMALERDTRVFIAPPDAGFAAALADVSGVLENDVTAETCHAVLRHHGITHVFVGVIERNAWSDLERFRDERLFEPVYDRTGIAVFALK